MNKNSVRNMALALLIMVGNIQQKNNSHVDEKNFLSNTRFVFYMPGL